MKKKIPVIISVILIILVATSICFRKDITAILASYGYKNSLSAERQAVYDKMKIEYVNIKNRATGTTPFNSGTTSDTEGNDVSEKDDYIRTFDVMKYTVELGISPNTAADGVTGASTFKGGVIKVRAKLPTQGDLVLMTWEQDAWMQNVTYNSTKTEIYAEYHVPSGVSVTNANQNLSFTVKLNGYKKEVTTDMAPEFEVWMEGNKPDNQTSSAESITVKDTERKIIISAHQSFDINVTYGPYLNLQGTRTINNKDTRGQYMNYGLGIALQQDVAGISDLRGLEYPIGKFEVKLKLEYYYSNETTNSGWILLDENDTKALDKINGTEIIEWGINRDIKNTYYPVSSYTAGVANLPNGRLNIGSANTSVQNSGDMTFTKDGEYITITFDNYTLNGIFPKRTFDAGSDNIAATTGYFATANFEVFSPYYDDGAYSYLYQFAVQAEEATYNTVNQKNIKMAPNSNGVVSDYSVGNNRSAQSIRNFLSGNVWTAIRSYNDSQSTQLDNLWYYGNGSLIKGEDFVVRGYMRMQDGPYLGGSDNLYVWNTNFFNIKPYNSTDYYGRSCGSVTGIACPSWDNLKVSYGIYKNNPTKGVNDDTLVQSAVYEDFTWYETAEQAQANGLIAAVFVNDPDNFGNTVERTTYLRFNALDNANNIGKVGIIRYKSRFYGDKERKNVYYYGGEARYKSTDGYHQTEYNADGTIKNYESYEYYGESILILGLKSSVITSVSDVDSNGDKKKAYDVGDGEVKVLISPTLVNGGAVKDDDAHVSKVVVKSHLPLGLGYKNGSANKEPKSVTINADGTTTIVWEYDNWQINHAAPEYPNITYTAEISASLENNQELEIKSTIFTEQDLRDEVQFRTGKYGIIVSNLAGSKAIKSVDKPVVDTNESFSVTSTIGNTSQENLRNVKSIEILPTNGDINGSIFTGTYNMQVTSLAANQKLYYSTNNIAAIGLTEDKYGKLTIKDVNLANDSRWIEVKVGETIPENATAIASQIDVVEPYANLSYKLQVNPKNNAQGNIYAFTMNVTSDNLAQAVKSNTVVATVTTRNIEGFAFIDNNRNNIYDEGDSLLKNNIVKLLDANNNVVATTQTDSNGKYIFTKVAKGQYYIEFSIPTNYELVSKNAGTANVSSATNTNNKTDLITGQNNAPTKEVVTIENQNLGIRKIDAVLTVHHYIDGTTTKLADDQISTVYYGDTYTTAIHPDIPDNYELKSKSNNYTGTVSSKTIDVIYYYQKKDSSLETSITKEGPEEITKKDEVVEYKITYTAKVVDYIGNGTITIIDTLPYHIDTEKSELSEGIYDEETNTITWTIPWNGIDSFNNKGETTIEKTISLVYTDVDPTERMMTNSVKGSIKLDNNSRDIENQSKTKIKVPGTIIVHHYEKGTETKLVDDETYTELVGEELTTSALKKDGYIIHKPDTEEYIFTEEEQEVIYEYEKIKVKVNTQVDGIGGTIEGDEDVLYGDDSTKDKIVIKPEEGYVLSEIYINGQKIEITEADRDGLVLQNFHEMKENMNVVVKFTKLVEEVNPDTITFLNILIILAIPISLVITRYLIKKKQMLEI